MELRAFVMLMTLPLRWEITYFSKASPLCFGDDEPELKINFHKSFFYNLSWCEDVTMKVTSILNCSIVSFPFTYLAFPIKTTALSRVDWQSLIDKVKKRFPIWKVMHSLEVKVSSLLTPFCLYCSSTICSSTIYQIGWFMPLHGGIRLLNWQLVCSHKNEGG